MIEISNNNYKIGDFVKGTTLSSRYYNKCDVSMIKAVIQKVEQRPKSVMLNIEILEHVDFNFVGRRFLVNQIYMQKVSKDKDVVFDIENNEVLLKEAISIQGRFYTKNVNAFFVRGKWYSKNSDVIALDSYTNNYEYKDLLLDGIIGTDNKKGYFTTNSPFVKSDNGLLFLSKECAIGNGLKESIFDGIFYQKESSMPKGKVAYSSQTDNFKNVFKNKSKNTHPVDPNYINKIQLGVDSPSYRITGGYRATFGVEVETSKGLLPVHVVKERNLNVKCMHDGSIKGGEYVTGILKGDTGFKNLHKILTELSKRCEIDNKTGVHVHIGGIKYDKEFVVFSYMLALNMEKEMQSMLPSTRRGDTKAEWGVRDNGQKFSEMCKNLPKLNFNEFYIHKDKMSIDLWNYYIDKYYKLIYSFLTGGTSLEKDYIMGGSHPKIGGTNRWISERYYWFNLIPCCFTKVRSDRDEDFEETFSSNSFIKRFNQTIEFRNHGGSLNYEKIKNWILICMSFIKYVQENKREILNNYNDNISLDKIVNSFFSKSPERGKELISYINSRKLKFKKDVTKSFESDDMITNEKSLKELCV